MDAELPGVADGIREDNEERDRHGWNSYENYRQIHETRLGQHPFVDHSRPHTIQFEFVEAYGQRFLSVEGRVYCNNDVVVEVRKTLEVQARQRRIWVRGWLYTYHGWVEGKHPLLRYDNHHEDDDYHCHLYDVNTGEQIERRCLTRNQFPLMSEVLDELQRMVSGDGHEDVLSVHWCIPVDR